MGLDSSKLVRELRGPIQLTFDIKIGRPNNTEHNKMFTTECGVICRNHAPLRLSCWGDISSTDYGELVRRLQNKFQWDVTDTVATEFINKQLGQVWRQQRCDHAKRIQELIAKGSDPHAHPVSGVTQADWEWIVDFIRSDTYQARSMTNKANREKQLFGHRAGSKPFVMHQKQKEVGPVDLFKDTHFSESKGWISDEAAARYREMEERRQSQSQSTVEGDPTSFNELEITQEVLGDRSGYVRGLGWGPRPANYGQCNTNNTMSPSSAVSELGRLREQLETQREQMETQRVQLETQREQMEAQRAQLETLATLQPVMSALLQRFPELGGLTCVPQPQNPQLQEVPQQPGLESMPSNSRDPSLPSDL
ncbi:hypothetical protein QJS10_CPA09g00902 [Acorus calamus]|uniref:Transposase, Ptta/En/Spm, plant n=1 Tax=Acorus calamus TaxID=4465 RepID=A0AAV9E3A0_ACOCL|nr:hypothetical protein QJS10_CPA09g00902 [Acorus calamus]